MIVNVWVVQWRQKKSKKHTAAFFLSVLLVFVFWQRRKARFLHKWFISKVEWYVVGFEICFFFQEKFISELLETTSLFKFHEKYVNRS